MTTVGTAQRRGITEQRAAAPIDETFIPSGVLPKGGRAVREAPRASQIRAHRENAARLLMRYRLADVRGKFLHFSGAGFTDQVAYAWVGFARNLAALRERHPELRILRVVQVPPDSRGGFTPTASRGW